MTMIKFNYNDSYGQPSRGSLAFMPHRRHAANETEILPKPFTVPLLNGETTVNLQPNSSTWVWIITEYFENKAKSFYTTIPDRDGVIPHTELVHISPSSLPAAYDAVEPVWWAEMRAYKDTVAKTLLESSEALTEAQQAIEIGQESIERTQYNASTAKAYSEQSRDHSYAARDYRDEAKTWRDEAQEQADRAANGPESAAQRAETAADRAETAETRAVEAEDEARVHAANARTDATTATTQAGAATTQASNALAEANRAKNEADRAQVYADELMVGPRDYVEQAEAARDAAQGHANTAATHANNAAASEVTAGNHVNDAQAHAQAALNAANDAEQYYTDMDTKIAHGPWITPVLSNEWESTEYSPFRYRIRNDGDLQIIGSINSGTREPNTLLCDDFGDFQEQQPFRNLAFAASAPYSVEFTGGQLFLRNTGTGSAAVWFDMTIPAA